MIRLQRGPAPPFFVSDSLHAERERLGEWYAKPLADRAQRRPPVQLYPRLKREARAAILALSRGKCAYCETPLTGDTAWDVEAYRPKAGALDLNGTVSPDHYWWLAYEWSNHFASCATCNRLKGPRFPVAGQRAPLLATGEALDAEQPLLLDPFRDVPQEHLVFDENGEVAGRTERGRVTIEVLGLNRAWLLDARRAAVEELRRRVEPLRRESEHSIAKAIPELVPDTIPFAGAQQSFLAALVHQLGYTQSDVLVASLVSEDERKEKLDALHRESARQESYAVDHAESKRDYYIRTRFIERIEIENFRAIERMELRISAGAGRPESDAAAGTEAPAPLGAPWLMLLGENGVGKSSVLQAVALCLLGDRWRDGFTKRLGIDARGIVRVGAERGEVRVYLTGGREPIALFFSRESREFRSNLGEPKVLLLGYGSTRLLPHAGIEVQGRFDFVQTDNLFNPFVPLTDASAWLLGLDDAVFERVADALKPLLQLGDEDRLVRVRGARAPGVEAELHGTRVPLEGLSDGYQSVLALVCDIMRVMLNRWPTMEAAEGIVLLDEIGSHLHPRWRMRIVGALRRTFPRVEFLASTHDPLCLRGLDDGEVAVMRRDARGRVTALTAGLPPIRGLRVDQLLTSELFGMSSTIDPEVEALFTEYYRLLASPARTEAEQSRVAELRDALERFRLLGTNRRERMMLEVIDQYLATEPDVPTEQLRAPLAEGTKQRLRAIWASAGAVST
jgi:hypothetical protein